MTRYNHNSAELAKRISERLQLDEETSRELFDQLSKIPNGPVKDAMDILVKGYRTATDDEQRVKTAVKNAVDVLEHGSEPQKYAALRDVRRLLETKLNKRKYVACIKGTCVRDAQYSVHADADPLDDGARMDANEAPIFIGIIEAETPVRAKQIMAARENIDMDVIVLTEI